MINDGKWLETSWKLTQYKRTSSSLWTPKLSPKCETFLRCALSNNSDFVERGELNESYYYYYCYHYYYYYYLLSSSLLQLDYYHCNCYHCHTTIITVITVTITLILMTYYDAHLRTYLMRKCYRDYENGIGNKSCWDDGIVERWIALRDEIFDEHYHETIANFLESINHSCTSRETNASVSTN